jgi:hypothetical protein
LQSIAFFSIVIFIKNAVKKTDKSDNKKAHKNVRFFKFGAPKEIRTPDPLVRSQVLYPAELWAHCFIAKYFTLKLGIIIP